jgi:1,4-alpha-glucan branching enzyme
MPDYLKRLPLLLGLTGCAIGVAQGAAGLDEYLYPRDDLGAVYSPQATTIKLWAPAAKAVNIALFADATNSAFSLVPMSCDNGGVWSATLEGDQDGRTSSWSIMGTGRLGS